MIWLKQIWISCLLLCCCWPLVLEAQYTQPYRLQWGTDLGIAAGSLSLGTTAFLLDRRVEALSLSEIRALDRMNVPALDRGATRQWSRPAAKWSDGFLAGGGLAPLLLLGSPTVRQDGLRAAAITAQAYTLTYALTSLTKSLVKRPRPFLYNHEASIPEHFLQDKDSRYAFFSGHTSMAAVGSFVAAKMYNDYHPNSPLRPWVWAGAAVVPAITGWLRYRAGKHFPTDIVVGYAVGALVGILLPEWHRHIGR